MVLHALITFTLNCQSIRATKAFIITCICLVVYTMFIYTLYIKSIIVYIVTVAPEWNSSWCLESSRHISIDTQTRSWSLVASIPLTSSDRSATGRPCLWDVRYLVYRYVADISVMADSILNWFIHVVTNVTSGRVLPAKRYKSLTDYLHRCSFRKNCPVCTCDDDEVNSWM